LGSGGDSYVNIGILAYPAANANTALTVTVSGNTIETEGLADEVFAISAADDDSDPDDDSTADSKAAISLNVHNNTIALGSLTQGLTAINAGVNLFTNFNGPDGDELFYLENLDVQNNTIAIDTAGNEGAIGINAGLIRQPALIANNVISITGSVSVSVPLLTYLSDIDVVYNTIYTDTVTSQALGWTAFATDSETESVNYRDKRIGEVANNIFHLRSTSNNSNDPTDCATMMFEEINNTVNASYVTAASPETFRNNDVFLDSDCQAQYVYGDATDVGTNTPIDTVTQLNAKTGFSASDPTISANNISADPDFTNLTAGDFTLLNTSPCLDAGLAFDTETWTDLLGTARPLGDAVDMGAYEFLEL
ncbi:MAG: hypothetical protein ACD_62C00243G0001, partial [uncultured bacterium]